MEPGNSAENSTINEQAFNSISSHEIIPATENDDRLVEIVDINSSTSKNIDICSFENDENVKSFSSNENINTSLLSQKEASDSSHIEDDAIKSEDDNSHKKDERFTCQNYNIPELQNFEPEVVSRFLRKYGSFSKADAGTLTNKERKIIRKFSELWARKNDKRNKPRPKRNRYDQKMASSKCKQRVAFDLSYFNENLMRYIDMRMCIKQIHRCYSENRKLKDPLQFHVTSVTGKGKEILALNIGYENWDVNLHDKSFLEVFPKEEIVYLTSESENVIDTLDDSKVYIIGGLLDHNSLKGLSYKRAVACNIAHGRLPIDKYMDMKKLKVLPINQVYSVLSLLASGKSWSEAFVLTIPQRKEAVLKTRDSTKTEKMENVT